VLTYGKKHIINYFNMEYKIINKRLRELHSEIREKIERGKQILKEREALEEELKKVSLEVEALKDVALPIGKKEFEQFKDDKYDYLDRVDSDPEVEDGMILITGNYLEEAKQNIDETLKKLEEQK